MRRAVWACVSLVVLTCGLVSSGWAVERELCGVRLGEKALDLLDKAGYGQPAYIGPLATIAVAAPEQPQAGAAGAAGGAAAAFRSGPSGPSARGEGRAGRGAGRAGRGMGAGGGRGMGGRGGGMRGGGMRAGGMGGRGMQVAARGAGAVRAVAGARAAGPGMYWYYRRPGGAMAVLTLNLAGEVTAITLSGIGPTPGGRTTRGIGLGSGYMEIIAQYGYPDQVVSAGATLELTYVDHGVRFTLDSMRVREIAIGAHIAAEAEAAPVIPEVTPPPAGMSIEELRGYL